MKIYIQNCCITASTVVSQYTGILLCMLHNVPCMHCCIKQVLCNKQMASTRDAKDQVKGDFFVVEVIDRNTIIRPNSHTMPRRKFPARISLLRL